MKKLFLFLLAFISISASAQIYQSQNGYGFQYKRLKIDSTLHIPTFNGIPDLRNSVDSSTAAIAIDSTNGKFYFYNPSTKAWSEIAGGTGTTDTALISQIVHDSLLVFDLSGYYTKDQVDSITNILVTDLGAKQDTSVHTYFYTESPILARDTTSGAIISFDKLNLPELRYSLTDRDTTNWKDSTLIDKKFLTDRLAAFTPGGGGTERGLVPPELNPIVISNLYTATLTANKFFTITPTSDLTTAWIVFPNPSDGDSFDFNNGRIEMLITKKINNLILLRTGRNSDTTFSTIENAYGIFVYNKQDSTWYGGFSGLKQTAGGGTSNDADSLDGQPGSYYAPVSSVPVNVSDLPNDAGYINDISGKADKTTTVNGHALSSNVTISKSDVGLGSVDNTSDVSKPVSTAVQTALDLKANDNAVMHLAGTESASGTKSFPGEIRTNVINTVTGSVMKFKTNYNDGLTIDANGTGTFRGAMSSQQAIDSQYNPILGQLYPTRKWWLIFGDSFSSSLASTNAYPYYVVQKVKFQNAATLAIPGNKISQQMAVLDSVLAVNPTYINQFGIISLLVGPNDYAQNEALGTYSDDSSALTFAGYLRKFIIKILNQSPSVQLYIITPTEGNGAGVSYRTNNTAGWKMADLAALEATICADYSVQVIDLHSISQFNLQTLSTMTVEGLHPNAVGGKFIAEIIANAFISRISNAGTSIALSKVDSSKVASMLTPYALNSGIVHTTGAETIAGIKTFSNYANIGSWTVGNLGIGLYSGSGAAYGYIAAPNATYNYGIGWVGGTSLSNSSIPFLLLHQNGSVIIKGAPSQSANLFQFRDNSNNYLGGITSAGQLKTGLTSGTPGTDQIVVYNTSDSLLKKISATFYAPLVSASLTTPTTVTFPSAKDSSGKLAPTAYVDRAVANNTTDVYTTYPLQVRQTVVPDSTIFSYAPSYSDSILALINSKAPIVNPVFTGTVVKLNSDSLAKLSDVRNAVPDYSLRETYANQAAAVAAGKPNGYVYKVNKNAAGNILLAIVDTVLAPAPLTFIYDNTGGGFPVGNFYANTTTTGDSIHVDWGDGTIVNEVEVSKAFKMSHTYSSNALFTIKVSFSKAGVSVNANIRQLIDTASGTAATASGIKEVHNLTQLSGLTNLIMPFSQIASFDTIALPSSLLVLNLGGNKLTNFAPATLPPNLQNINLQNNVLGDLTGIPLPPTLTTFTATSLGVSNTNWRNGTYVNNILVYLDGLTFTSPGTINVKQYVGTAAPTGAGATAKASLISKGWAVTTD